MRRILSMLMENEAGALSRVVGLFAQRGYNIETLNVAATDDPTLSRLTLTTLGDDLHIEQVTKQFNKLVDVVKVVDLTEGAHVERDLMLNQGAGQWCLPGTRSNEPRTFSADRSSMWVRTSTPFSLVGTADKLDSFVAAMDDVDILEVVRSGVAGISRGEKVLSL